MTKHAVSHRAELQQMLGNAADDLEHLPGSIGGALESAEEALKYIDSAIKEWKDWSDRSEGFRSLAATGIFLRTMIPELKNMLGNAEDAAHLLAEAHSDSDDELGFA